MMVRLMNQHYNDCRGVPVLAHIEFLFLFTSNNKKNLSLGIVFCFCRTQLHQDDNALILFSSGTTGESKGVVLTHRNIIAMCLIMTSERVDAGLNSVVLHLLPMFHVFGLMVTLANLARGSTVVMLPRFDFLAMLEAIQKYRITATPLVPPILLLMIKQDVVLKYDMSSLQNIGCGAAPLGEDLLARCALRFPNAKLLQVKCTEFSFHFRLTNCNIPQQG